MTSYATVEDYRTDTGDSASDAARVESMLAQQSAKLRARAGIADGRTLTEDQLLMCRALVTDACRKALVKPSVDAFGDLTGLTQGTFSANGFSGSFQNANGSGAAYFDRDTLRALMRSLGTSQTSGTVIPSYGRL
ncbi:MAG: hypothetical protein PUF11_04130 [Parafannyhessea umbonata]|uniref:hypothetical protein n=1 Tax=Parafannyhessea umbonata TaxID=604330 RepID=UPI0026EF2725|nr:hypothetical protein [Parafannyhessea umbonata]MDD6565961.1 hypothetical protein [Parafannyhessea umbonata]